MNTRDEVEAARTLLVKANRILAHEGIVDDFGHVSVRHPADPGRYLLSCAISPARVIRDDILDYRLDGALVSDPGGRQSYSERAIHGAIYEARPDVGAVCHHHSGAMLAFASSGAALRPVYHLGAVLGGAVPVWDSQEEFGDTSLLVDDMNKSRALARRLAHRPVILLRRHGTVVAADDLKQAVMTAIYSAENAAVQARAMSLGDVSYLTEGEIARARATNLGPVGIARSWPNRCLRAGLDPD